MIVLCVSIPSISFSQKNTPWAKNSQFDMLHYMLLKAKGNIDTFACHRIIMGGSQETPIKLPFPSAGQQVDS